MLKALRLVTAAAAAAFVLPAVAGPSWPPTPPRKAEARAAPAPKIAEARQARVVNGFEYIGGEALWQLSQHKYDFVDGRFTMSDECDHAMRIVKAPTQEEIESARRLSPGA